VFFTALLHSHNNAKGKNHCTAIALGPLQARASQEQNPKPIFSRKVLPPYRTGILLCERNYLQEGRKNIFYIVLTK
jgi:hypothetical protein